jgi:hypothetical protein
MLAVILMVVMVFILFIFAPAGLDDLQIGSGVPASSGVASGAIVFTNEDAVAWHKMGRSVILCREEICTDDVEGFKVECRPLC